MNTAAIITVEISDTQSHLRVDREWLARLARAVVEDEGVGGASISIALVDDAAIREINARHLDHDWPTDVISFRLSEEGDSELVGELVVSAEMAVATAREWGLDARAELALYVAHGLLHLCGHDDTTPEGAAAMRRRESEVLTRAGLENTFPKVGSSALEDQGSGQGSARWPV